MDGPNAKAKEDRGLLENKNIINLFEKKLNFIIWL